MPQELLSVESPAGGGGGLERKWAAAAWEESWAHLTRVIANQGQLTVSTSKTVGIAKEARMVHSNMKSNCLNIRKTESWSMNLQGPTPQAEHKD